MEQAAETIAAFNWPGRHRRKVVGSAGRALTEPLVGPSLAGELDQHSFQMTPAKDQQVVEFCRRDRLGGLLHEYRRAA